MRKNGFSCPLHPKQVCLWVLTVVQVGGFYGVLMPLLPFYQAIALGVVVGVAGIGVVVCGGLATGIDPTDQVVYQERKARLSCTDFPYQHYPQVCSICASHVSPGTKHCGYCRRCVSDFDHHCKWLNNCIGGRNYRVFFLLLVAMNAMLIGEEVAVGWCWVYLQQGDNMETIGKEMNLAFLTIISILTSVQLVLVSALMLFHVFLKWKGLSTYEYILRRQGNTGKVRHYSDSDAQDRTRLENSSLHIRCKQKMASTFCESLRPIKSHFEVQFSEIQQKSKSDI